jgi:hypothetical protein
MLRPFFKGMRKKSSQKMTFSCGVVSGATGQKREKMTPLKKHSAGRAATKKPLRTSRTTIRRSQRVAESEVMA